MTGGDVVSLNYRHSDNPSSPGIMISRTIRSNAPAFKMAPGLGRVRRHSHAHAVLDQELGQQVADLLMVVNDKNMVRGFH